MLYLCTLLYSSTAINIVNLQAMLFLFYQAAKSHRRKILISFIELYIHAASLKWFLEWLAWEFRVGSSKLKLRIVGQSAKCTHSTRNARQYSCGFSVIIYLIPPIRPPPQYHIITCHTCTTPSPHSTHDNMATCEIYTRLTNILEFLLENFYVIPDYLLTQVRNYHHFCVYFVLYISYKLYKSKSKTLYIA